MPEFRAPRIRMPKVTLPGRAGGRAPKPTASKAKTKEQPKAGNGAKPADSKETATKEATKPTAAKDAAGPKAAATQPAGSKSPDPNLQERMEGLQGWMAEIERKQGRITYFGIAGILIALLVAGAALYFGLTTKSDSATNGDLDALTKRIDALEAAATKNSKDTQAALNSSVAQLQQSIAAVQKQQAANAASLSTLQSQASAAALGKGAQGAGTTVTPGATTTTTPAPNK
jgi:uncharacterized coiled-coil protein SlyX